jgi:phosphoribosylamine---glycine ligase
MKILLLGSGGREHALAWKMSQSPLCKELFIAPGNGGTAAHGTNVPLPINDFDKIKKFVLKIGIDMVVVGPEEPLVRGIWDFFKTDVDLKQIAVIAPSKEGAQLEGSKAFAKKFMAEAQIPTAAYCEVNHYQEGVDFLKTLKPPYVLKADGLAAGKGVLIINELAEAERELKAMLEGKFGAASSKVVIEAFLKGIEFSVFVLTDGSNYKILPVAKDYKRVGEGDTGLNTGGMGAVSPVPFVDKTMMSKVEERIIIPTINHLKARNIIYNGFIFIGLISVEGEPFVIEYNCRLGDPETEVVIPRLRNDLVKLFDLLDKGRLSEASIMQDRRTATTVMLTAGGYPNHYKKGDVITNLPQNEAALVFHAGTHALPDGKLVTNGGRVIAVTALGDDMEAALAISNQNAKTICFENKYYRTDIGLDLMMEKV